MRDDWRIYKFARNCCWILAILLYCNTSSVAQDKSQIKQTNLFEKYSAPELPLNNAYCFVLQAKLTATKKLRILRQVSEDIQIVSFDDQSVREEYLATQKIQPANFDWKFSPYIESRKSILEKDKRNKDFILSGDNIEELMDELQRLNIPVRTFNKTSATIIINSRFQAILQKLLPLRNIIFIDESVSAQSESAIIGYNRSFQGINAIDYTFPGINGKNIVVGVKEQNMDSTDLDLYKRVIPSVLAAPLIQAHATTIASIIGGAGNSFYDGRGLAHRAKFFPSSFATLFADDASILSNNKVYLQNHSYGTLPQQFYGAEAVSYDLHCWTNKQFLHVFSAGNRGTSAATDGRYIGITGFANLTGNFKMAKNVLTIGAIDNTGNIATESSAGPIYDGRLAPQLVALGPNGTSDAAAVITGAAALLQQSYADSNNQQLPDASLLKAVLFTSADDLYSTGIDYKTGYGLLNIYKAVHLLLKRNFYNGSISQSQLWTKTISVPDSAASLKLTLCWTDSAAQVNNNKALINDLDLELKEVSTGKIFKPWVLDSQANADSLKLLPKRKRDSLNTSEQISINLPAAGDYDIRVIGSSISSASIPFHIAFSIDSLNKFEFLSPQHSSDVNRSEGENIFVKWSTAVADTNQLGQLFISYNAGISWQFVQAVRLMKQQTIWSIKDTISSARFKMETGFGSFFSKDFMISPVIRPRIDFNCTDSFQISWKPQTSAIAYSIYALTDSSHLKKIIETVDTFRVFKKSDYPGLVYAVEPILSNQIQASRSVAFNIDFQGVNCFYKTLNFNQINNTSINLVLELSTNKNIDSLVFEMVSPAGILVQQIAATKPNAGSLINTQAVKELKGGTHYFRVRIRLVNGQSVYTNIISVLISGTGLILFYPNPTGRDYLNYVLQQGVPGDCRLIFYDAMGRIIKDYHSIPAVIDVKTFPTGVIFYKLLLPDGSKRETGKIIILSK